MNDNAGGTSIAHAYAELERRVQALEARVAELPTSAPIDASIPPSFKDIELPIPSMQAMVETAKTTWTLFEIFGELTMLFWTLFDRRYHMAWITRVTTIILLVLILTSHWWVPLASFDNPISHVWDKLIDLALGLVLFVVLSFETRRYKEWRTRR